MPDDKHSKVALVKREGAQQAAADAEQRADQESRATAEPAHQHAGGQRGDGGADHHGRHRQRRQPLVGREHGAEDGGKRHRQDDGGQHQGLA